MILQGEDKAQYLQAEGELAALLSNFNTDYIYQAVEDLLVDRNNNFTLQPKVNFVSTLEVSFKSMLVAYPSDKDNIYQVRDTTYMEILDKISEKCNIGINYTLEDTDMYTLANLIYDLFISRYDIHVFTFLKRFIIMQKDFIYTQLQLDQRKRSKDTSTIYNKNVYSDPKLALINANLEMCLQFIDSLDFNAEQTLSYIYYTNEERNTMNYLLNYIDPNTNLYDILIGNVFRNPYLSNPCFAYLRLIGNMQDDLEVTGMYSEKF